jgi:hypothetical protein
MTGMPAWRLAFGLLFLSIVLHVVGDTWYALRFGSGFNAIPFMIVYLSFSTVGSLIIAHYPRHPVGWIFCVIGLNFGLNNLLNCYADVALAASSGWPGGAVAAWFGWLWDINLFLLGTFLLLFFPTGRVPSPRWTFVAWLTGIAIAVVWVSEAFAPGPMMDYTTNNPFGISAAKDILSAADTIGLLVIVLCAFLSVISVVVRFRHSHSIERQQIKWFAFAASLQVPYVILIFTVTLPASDFVFALLVASLPATAGLAILRYRLYDIDRIINKTLVYGSLSAILVGADLLLVLGLEHLLNPIASGSDLIVAGSTLAVAALVRPLRSRIQTVVDRRFYRRKYDAARTLEAFSSRLRDQTDLAALATELGTVVQETMQPTQVSLWLRDFERVVGNDPESRTVQ